MRRDRDGQRPGLRVHVRPLSRGREGDGSSFPSSVPIWEIRSQHQPVVCPHPHVRPTLERVRFWLKAPLALG